MVRRRARPASLRRRVLAGAPAASVARLVVRTLGPVAVCRGLTRRMLVPWQFLATLAIATVDPALILARDDHRGLGDVMAGTMLVERR